MLELCLLELYMYNGNLIYVYSSILPCIESESYDP